MLRGTTRARTYSDLKSARFGSRRPVARPLASLGGGIAYAGLIGNPVYFPDFASVVREGLLEVRLVGIGVRPDKPDEDGFAVELAAIGRSDRIAHFCRRQDLKPVKVGRVQFV